ncbi:Transcription initiation factor TFIID subunit 12 [Tilletia horrida]|nr:Transcription initiation factor TFIID subunit 12 [Tilletia horrida]
MNPNQPQGPPGAGGGVPGGAGQQSNYSRQIAQAQQAAMRQVQAQQHQQQQQQVVMPVPGPGGLAPAPAPVQPGAAAAAPGLDANALATIQSAIQGAVNDPTRMQNLLSNLVASGKINPTQLAQIRAMLARNSQTTNPNMQRQAIPVQPGMQQAAPAPQPIAPGQGPQVGQPSNLSGQAQASGAKPAVATTPVARLAQIEAELLNEAKVNNEANAAADHVSQLIKELDARLATLQPGTEDHKRALEQRQETQNKLAGVGSRFMEAKKYYDDLRAQKAALRVALGSVANNPVALAAAGGAGRPTNLVPLPGGGVPPAQGQPGVPPQAVSAPGAVLQPVGPAGIVPAKVELSAAGNAAAVNPVALGLAPGQAAGGAAAPVQATGAGGAGAADQAANAPVNRPLVGVPQTANRIEVTAPSATGDAFPASRGPRPTLSQGLAAPNPVVATPGTLSRPNMIGTPGGGAGAAGGAAAASSSSAVGAAAGAVRPSSPTVATAANWEELLGVAARESGKMVGKAVAAQQQASGSGGANDDFEVISVTPGPGVASSTFYTSGGGAAGGSASAGRPVARAAPAASALGTSGGSGGGYVSASASSFGVNSLIAAPENRLLNKRKVQELVGEIDSGEALEADVEDLILEMADEFIESVTHFACKLAKHRRGEKLEVKDVQLHLERNWNIRVPFPGSMPIPPPRTRASGTTTKGGAGGNS